MWYFWRGGTNVMPILVFRISTDIHCVFQWVFVFVCNNTSRYASGSQGHSNNDRKQMCQEKRIQKLVTLWLRGVFFPSFGIQNEDFSGFPFRVWLPYKVNNCWVNKQLGFKKKNPFSWKWSIFYHCRRFTLIAYSDKKFSLITPFSGHACLQYFIWVQ